MAILADGLVQGSITGGDTSASVEAVVSCVNGTPTGSISGTVDTFTGMGTSRFTFSSGSPAVVATLAAAQSVFAYFANVTVRNVTANRTFTGCKVFLTATRLNEDLWIGSFVVKCPGGPTLVIFGGFTGETKVNRQVLCKPLL